MTAFIPRSLVFGVALGLLAGVGSAAGGSVEAAARTMGPAAEQGRLTDDDGSDVAGAAVDLADAEQWLAELESGNFANIFVIAEDGSMRCGEIAANPGCQPLTLADRASAIAEAREAVGFALTAVEDAQKTFAAQEDVQNAAYAP